MQRLLRIGGSWGRMHRLGWFVALRMREVVVLFGSDFCRMLIVRMEYLESVGLREHFRWWHHELIEILVKFLPGYLFDPWWSLNYLPIPLDVWTTSGALILKVSESLVLLGPKTIGPAFARNDPEPIANTEDTTLTNPTILSAFWIKDPRKVVFNTQEEAASGLYKTRWSERCRYKCRWMIKYEIYGNPGDLLYTTWDKREVELIALRSWIVGKVEASQKRSRTHYSPLNNGCIDTSSSSQNKYERTPYS